MGGTRRASSEVGPETARRPSPIVPSYARPSRSADDESFQPPSWKKGRFSDRFFYPGQVDGTVATGMRGGLRTMSNRCRDTGGFNQGGDRGSASCRPSVNDHGVRGRRVCLVLAACRRGVADDAATSPCSQACTGANPAPEQGGGSESGSQLPISLAKSVWRPVSMGGMASTPDGERRRNRHSRPIETSSKESETGFELRTEKDRNTGQVGRFKKYRRARVHRVRRGRPPRSPIKEGRGLSGPEPLAGVGPATLHRKPGISLASCRYFHASAAITCGGSPSASRSE